MIGYHYTSFERYKSIVRDGLQPYPIDKNKQVDPYTKDGAIWVFKNQFHGVELLGQLVFHIVSKGTTLLVCLEVTYQEDVSLECIYKRDTGDSLKMTHDLPDVGIMSHTESRYDLILRPCRTFIMINFWDLRADKCCISTIK